MTKKEELEIKKLEYLKKTGDIREQVFNDYNKKKYNFLDEENNLREKISAKIVGYFFILSIIIILWQVDVSYDFLSFISTMLPLSWFFVGTSLFGTIYGNIKKIKNVHSDNKKMDDKHIELSKELIEINNLIMEYFNRKQLDLIDEDVNEMQSIIEMVGKEKNLFELRAAVFEDMIKNNEEELKKEKQKRLVYRR